MSLSNSLPKTVRKGIQHAMMWVDRRQSVFLQLISYNANQLLHSFIIVCPVTDNLEKRKIKIILGQQLLLIRTRYFTS